MLVYLLQQHFSVENLLYLFVNKHELQLQWVDIRSKPDPFSFLTWCLNFETIVPNN